MKKYIKYMTPEEIVKRLNDGEIIKDDNTEKYFKMIDGQICHLGKYYCVIGTKIRTDKQYYFETEESTEIKETGLYKTRDGRKAFVSKIYETYILGIIENEEEMISWNLKGSVSENRQNNQDIIGKWED